MRFRGLFPAVGARLARASGVVATGAVLAFAMQLALRAIEHGPWPRRARPVLPVPAAPRIAVTPPAPAAPAALVPDAERPGALMAWRYRPYATYLFGLAIGFSAFWMYQTAQAWLALQLTNSAAGLSLLFTVSSFPMLVLMLFGGVLADRFDRKGVIIVSRMFQAAATAGMGLLTLAGLMTIPMFVVFALLLGVIQALNLPARHAFLADLLPPSALHNGYSWQSVVDFAASTAGPVAAGYVVAVWGAGEALIISGIGHCIMCAFVLFVRPLNRGGRSSESVVKRIAGGVKYVSRHQQIILIMLLASIPALTVWGVLPLLPIVARDILGGNAGTYGWLNGAIGVGSIGGALFVAASHRIREKGLLAVLGAVCTGLAMVGVAYTQSVAVAMAFLLVVGMAIGVQSTLAQSLVQVLTPSEYQGRVASIFMLTWNLQPFGVILFGFVAEQSTVPYAYWAAGLSMAAATSALAILRPALVRIRV